MSETSSRLENQINHFVALGKWDKVESLWQQVLEDPIPQAKFYATLAAHMVRAEKATELKAWTTLLIEACQTKNNYKEIIQIARGVLHSLPDFTELRAPLLEALKHHHSNLARIEEFLEASGIANAPTLFIPLNKFLQYISCSEGQCFIHDHWGAGQVTKLDIPGDRVHFHFQEQGDKSFSFAGVKEYLKKLPKTHFLAQRMINPKMLTKRAEAEPVEFLKYYLHNHHNSVARAKLKEDLLKGVFDEKGWNSWWGKNRDKFRFDPYIGFSTSAANPVMELRTEAKSFHEELLQEFLRVDSFAKRHNLLTEMLKRHEQEALSDAAAKKIHFVLDKALGECGGEQFAERLEYLYLIEDLNAVLSHKFNVDGLSADESLLKSLEPIALITALSVHDYQIRAADRLRNANPDAWNDLAEKLFFAGTQRLAQWILKELIAQGHTDQAIHLAEQMLHRPDENPELFLWMVRTLREGKWPELPVEISPQLMFDAVMEIIQTCSVQIAHEVIDAAKYRGVKSRFENLLTENRQALIAEAFQDMEIEDVRRRHTEIMGNPALNEAFKLAFDNAVRSVCYNLDHDDGSASSTESNEHFVTKASFEARQKEYQQIKNTDIPANSKAIGEAAAMGDLSENAEYHSAKERQKVLFRRKEALEDLLQRARTLEPNQVDTSVVGFGTKFKIRNQDNGKMEEYTLLGLWDADPEKNILSYLTPFGKQFMKKQAGDTLVVTQPSGNTIRYEVLEINNALK
ncbi:TPA: hypothetical protein DDW35_10055 [Candidatus Sumerlaeota bacterium]|jgi:transcription elongation factor GreA|nr:hypothetical protein [Candidatus Sumerlaeota bacterium]